MNRMLSNEMSGPVAEPRPSGRRARRTSGGRRPLSGCMLAGLIFMCPLTVGAAEAQAGATVGSADANLHQWQVRRLNQPTERERQHERDGHVYVYDGMTDREVDHALSAHFDRIEYMMFVGTLKTVPAVAAQSEGPATVETESPGCM